MSTWTTADRDRIISHLNLTLEYRKLIQDLLEKYESLYGASAIFEVQSKLNSLDSRAESIDCKMTDGKSGITQESVQDFYSITRQSGSDIRATMTLYNGDRQWLIDNLKLQSFVSLSGKHTRA